MQTDEACVNICKQRTQHMQEHKHICRTIQIKTHCEHQWIRRCI